MAVTKTYETWLSLSDYMSDELIEERGSYRDAKEAALEGCSGDAAKALAEFRRLGGDLLDGMAVGAAEFLEFDSTNISHGQAFFRVSVAGTEEQHAALAEALGQGDDL